MDKSDEYKVEAGGPAHQKENEPDKFENVELVIENAWNAVRRSRFDPVQKEDPKRLLIAISHLFVRFVGLLRLEAFLFRVMVVPRDTSQLRVAIHIDAGGC